MNPAFFVFHKVPHSHKNPEASEEIGNQENLYEKPEYADQYFYLLAIHAMVENLHNELFKVQKICIEFEQFQIS